MRNANHEPSGAPQNDDIEKGRMMGGWAYIARCSDDSLYVGATSYVDVQTRIDEHNDARYFGYTAARRPVVLVWARYFDNLTDAHEAGRRIKGLSRAKKLALIADDEAALEGASRRRSGRPQRRATSVTKRELSALSREIGARKKPPIVLPRPRNQSSTARGGGSDISTMKLASSRHHEVRARAERGGAPKDE